MEEVFHSPCDRSEFYSMANLSSAPVFFRPTYQTGEFQQCVSKQIYRPCVAYPKGNFYFSLSFNLIFLSFIVNFHAYFFSKENVAFARFFILFYV